MFPITAAVFNLLEFELSETDISDVEMAHARPISHPNGQMGIERNQCE